MTIKTRNRITFGFFIFALLISVAELSLFIFQVVKGNLQYPDVLKLESASSSFLLKTRNNCVITGIVLQNLYIVVTTIFILRAFEKTQSTEIFFFLFFLLANLCDSARLVIILYHITDTYSTAYLAIGNITLFARIMIPLSLMSTIILNEESHRQNLERNGVLLLVVAIFLASFIPLNTSIIKPNYLISFSYEKTIKITTLIIHCANIFTLFMQNLNKESKQYTTMGYLMLTIGNFMMFNSCNYVYLVLGYLFLTGGSAIFLRALHKYFLWND